jgi:glucokinase
VIVGVDIGGHHIAAALVDGGRRQLVENSYRHRETDRHAQRDELLDSWVSLIETVIGDGDDIAGVGVAMPGSFDYRTGLALFKGNGKFESLYGVNVRDEWHRRSHSSCEIRFLNDATAFAVGCVAMGAAPGSRRVLAVTLGTGLGSAFLEDGIPVIEDGEGRIPLHGSLWHLPFKDGIADDYVSSRWLLAETRARMGRDPESVADLAAMAREDKAARAILEDYGTNLAAIVAPWIRAFGADAIVMGGRITRAYELFAPALLWGLDQAAAVRPVSIHENTEDAAIVGAGMTFDEHFWRAVQSRLPRQ